MKDIVIVMNPERTVCLLGQLTALWEASVRASHDFLTERDVEQLIPVVTDGIAGVVTLVVAYHDDVPVAFMGIVSDKIEMLFVDGDYFGCGIGRELVTLAIGECEAKYVDVNEQNVKAVGFYRRMGFVAFCRTELDEQGNPFPLLKMKLSDFSIREADAADIPELQGLFRNTVLSINIRDYSLPEVEDWASCGNDISKWSDMISTHYFVVAQNDRQQIVGFSSITPQGYLHYMFVHKDFQKMGIATLLLDSVEQYAKNNQIADITTEASITARPFFEKWGYIVLAAQCRKANRLYLANFLMAKKYGDPEVSIK